MLTEHIDRLNADSAAIRVALSHPSISLPFTRAVLHSHLSDLIRDANIDEIGLFTLQHQQQQEPQLARVEFTGPTPIKPRKEEDPEVYARAALKYIDRFAPVRPMPRARSQVTEILEKSAGLREEIRSLSDTLQQQSIHTDPSSVKIQIEEEQDRMRRLQKKIDELKQRRETALRQQASPRKFTRPKSSWARKPAPAPPKAAEQDEESFWTAPTPSKGFQISSGGSLMDEEVSIADVSATFATPFASKKQATTPETEDYDYEDSIMSTPKPSSPAPRSISQPELEPEPEEEAEMKPEPEAELEPEPEPRPVIPDTPSPKKTKKIKVTTDVERIVAKIWGTMGDLLLPPLDTKLKAKETIAELQALASQDIGPSSPSASISSSSLATTPGPPTAQQILTAHLLISLLLAPPHHALSLAQVKECLNEKVGAILGQNPTRILYGCVAKRLLKIDRGGGEQVVKFDI